MLPNVYLRFTVLQQGLLTPNTRDIAAVNAMDTHARKKDDKIIFEIIDRVLTHVFGAEATSLIYAYLERRYSLSRSEIAAKIDVFAKALEEFFSSGAYAVENKILEDVYSSYGSIREAMLEKTPEEYDFASQIRIVMQKT
jgi:hypothetical protein